VWSVINRIEEAAATSTDAAGDHRLPVYRAG
jgi:hypothetical protein